MVAVGVLERDLRSVSEGPLSERMVRSYDRLVKGIESAAAGDSRGAQTAATGGREAPILTKAGGEGGIRNAGTDINPVQQISNSDRPPSYLTSPGLSCCDNETDF
jgi:hypothetical protein